MAITWKMLGQQVLAAGVLGVYAAPPSTSATITAAQLWNPTASPVTVDIYLFASGGTVTDATHIERVVVPAASSATAYGTINQKVPPGSTLAALGLGVTLTLGGAESV